jgi:hypothetical protein
LRQRRSRPDAIDGSREPGRSTNSSTGIAAVTFIELTPYADACALKQANVTKGDATTLSFLAPNDQMIVGRHPVTAVGTTLATFSRDDASCTTLNAGPTYDGSVTLSEVGADAVSGEPGYPTPDGSSLSLASGRAVVLQK